MPSPHALTFSGRILFPHPRDAAAPQLPESQLQAAPVDVDRAAPLAETALIGKHLHFDEITPGWVCLLLRRDSWVGIAWWVCAGAM